MTTNPVRFYTQKKAIKDQLIRLVCTTLKNAIKSQLIRLVFVSRKNRNIRVVKQG
jgi:hypothetical protein